ncbi:MAG: hypothetical protein J5926_02510 [Ruminococcus sp.]|nr:hypothetical protein [Ruminococcus sp.]
MLTNEEWFVIAIAAVIFVIINIIMWSIIAAKERRAKQADTRIKAVPVRSEQEHFTVPTTDPPRRTKHFNIKENIVITHTDERIR